MDSTRWFSCTTLLFAVILVGGGADRTSAQVVTLQPADGATFADRFQRARERTRATDGKRAWIGFEISRLMKVGSNFITSDRWSFHGTGWESDGMTLYELVEGRPPEVDRHSDDDQVRHAARLVLEELGHPLPRAEFTDRRVGVLLGIEETGSESTPAVDALWLGNMEMDFNFRGRVLLWLGRAEAGESIPVLQALLDQISAEDQRESIVSAIGVHTAPDVVVPALRDVLRSDPSAEVREEAAYWLGRQQSESALDALIWPAEHDVDPEVREEAVCSVERFVSERATSALIDRALRDDHREVREQAVEALGRRRSGEALEALLDVAFNDGNRGVQESAVESLARFPDRQSVPALARIAEDHPSAAVRDEVVEALRLSSSAEVVVVLSRIAREDSNAGVQKEALEALLSLPDERGIDALASIARNHSRSSMRREALELLMSSSGSEARKAAAEFATSG